MIAAQTCNHIEKFIIDRGHTAARALDDYGIDLVVNTFDDDGYAENGEILIQLKASDRPSYSADGTFVSLKVDRPHFELWAGEPMPVFLVLYDAAIGRAYWLYLQEAIRSGTVRRPGRGVERVTLRIPVANEFNAETVNLARRIKATILDRIEGIIDHYE